jgi:hypothetical protein
MVNIFITLIWRSLEPDPSVAIVGASERNLRRRDVVRIVERPARSGENQLVKPVSGGYSMRPIFTSL